MNSHELWSSTQRDPRWTFVEEFHQVVRVPIRTWWLQTEMDVGAIRVSVYASNEGGLRLFILSGLSHLTVRELRAGAGVRPEDMQSMCM